MTRGTMVIHLGYGSWKTKENGKGHEQMIHREDILKYIVGGGSALFIMEIYIEILYPGKDAVINSYVLLWNDSWAEHCVEIHIHIYVGTYWEDRRILQKLNTYSKRGNDCRR